MFFTILINTVPTSPEEKDEEKNQKRTWEDLSYD